MHLSSLIPRMLMFNSCHLLFDHFQFALIHGSNIPGSYAILLFTASNLASITSPIHNWVFFFFFFLLWLHPFILSGVISPLISNSILGTYWPGEFTFQCPIFLPFHTVYGILKARIWKWFSIPFSSGPHSVRPLHHDPSVLGGPTQHGLEAAVHLLSVRISSFPEGGWLQHNRVILLFSFPLWFITRWWIESPVLYNCLPILYIIACIC